MLAKPKLYICVHLSFIKSTYCVIHLFLFGQSPLARYSWQNCNLHFWDKSVWFSQMFLRESPILCIQILFLKNRVFKLICIELTKTLLKYIMNLDIYRHWYFKKCWFYFQRSHKTFLIFQLKSVIQQFLYQKGQCFYSQGHKLIHTK